MQVENDCLQTELLQKNIPWNWSLQREHVFINDKLPDLHTGPLVSLR